MAEIVIDDETLFFKNELDYNRKQAALLEFHLTKNGIRFNWDRSLNTNRQYVNYIKYLKRLCYKNNVKFEKAGGI